jgi:hypothetical protein
MATLKRRYLYLVLLIGIMAMIFTFVYAQGQAGSPAGQPGAPGGSPGGMGSGPGGQGGPGGMPPGGRSGGGPGGPGGPGGGGPPGGMGGAPSKAAIFIDNGAEDTAKEYTAGQYKANIKSDANGITIQNLDITSGDYAFNGIAAVGAKSSVTLDTCKMRLGVTKEAEANANGGAAASVSDNATMYIKNSDLQVDGALRYVTNNGDDAKLIVNDSIITQTGSNQFTSKMSEPFSNPALLISGIARANMSTGSSHTYYFNSTVTTEGWASLSTDAAGGDGLDLYAYNTKAIAQHGGYGTYADFDCRVWLYGSALTSAEVGGIISKDGQITVADGASVPADVIKYNLGKTTTAGSVVTGGRNAIMIHAPDMGGQGLASADCGFLDVISSTLATSRTLKSTRDYAAKYGAATGAYVDYVNGADLLIKSTSANINLQNAKFDSYTGVIIMTVLNSDSMGNFLKEGDGTKVKPIAISMKSMSVNGDIKHMDYQRIMTLSLDNGATLKGAVVSGTVEDWNKLWTAYKKEDCKWVQNDSWNTFYGVQMTVKKGATWEVSGPSTLSSLTLENGGTVKGKVQVDGKDVTLAAGKTYAGKIVVKPL